MGAIPPKWIMQEDLSFEETVNSSSKTSDFLAPDAPIRVFPRFANACQTKGGWLGLSYDKSVCPFAWWLLLCPLPAGTLIRLSTSLPKTLSSPRSAVWLFVPASHDSSASGEELQMNSLGSAAVSLSYHSPFVIDLLWFWRFFKSPEKKAVYQLRNL